ncbi:Crossover junction endonuclease mus81 [Lunasporangiospora selenospora]|uniref:Crossover junction endonuclease MUS81 n=1 Tax=Lunasporangiospora selenospora TaxID=979761 RepID=A0A9P6KHW0_9FUNG|nr:Crossover junction endonuclease mus81 [Lunasporangiospora selenospora]
MDPLECGNPLYLEWIGEWMEQARVSGNKQYYTYRKAYESMAKYPASFSHPIEAMCLSGVGSGIVGMLERRLAQYCKEHDIPMPTPKKRKTKAGEVANTDDSQLPKPKKPRNKIDKPYVPSFRSGAYAILLALLDAQEKDREGCLTKQDIQSRGQVYTDTSLTNADHGKIYTGWSSIKTLENKSLVYRAGTMFHLTEEGSDIAKRMRAISNGTGPPPSTEPAQPSSSNNGSDFANHPSRETQDDDGISGWDDFYMNSKLVSPTLAMASKKVPSSSSLASIDSSTYSPTSRPQSKSMDSQTVYLLSDSEDDSRNDTDSPKAGYSGSFHTNEREVQTSSKAGLQRTTTISNLSGSKHDGNGVSKENSTRSNLSFSRENRVGTSVFENSSPRHTTHLSGGREATDYQPFPSSRSNSFAGATDIEARKHTRSIAELAGFKPIVIHPGTYDIFLALDSREMRTLNDRDYFRQKLTEKGVDVDVRTLDIGDAVWMVRVKPEYSSVGQVEFVLDYIVERKRMDDLVFSIKDGRFDEQKFRLRRSGLANIIYLVETHIVGEVYDIGIDSLRSAMAGIQVHDGFFVKRTQNTDQTIDYYVSITNALKQLYKEKTFYGIPDSAVDRLTYLDLQSHLQDTYEERFYITTYKSFCTLNGKSDTLTVRDYFVKMLMTIRGVSSDKAVEIARVYRTPRALFSALDKEQGEANNARRRGLIAKAGSNVGRKKIGPALSAKITEIWYADQYQ